MIKKTCWLMVADRKQTGLALAIPTVAWIAQAAGVAFETYIENERTGKLFAKTGSTVLGGRHYNDFNYLNNIYEVKYIFFGETLLFRSSVEMFGCEVLADTSNLVTLYTRLLEKIGKLEVSRHTLLVLPAILEVAGFDLCPYCYPEIFNRKALAVPPELLESLSIQLNVGEVIGAFLDGKEALWITGQFHHIELFDVIEKADTIGSITVRIAERWQSWAQGVVFGDPEMVISLQATGCRERRVAVFAPQETLPIAKISVSAYTEERTAIADDVIRLCRATGNNVMIGRQTCDGDLIYWGGAGVCLQIMDPNRPVFPIFNQNPQPWVEIKTSVYEMEPDDETLRDWAAEGKILTSLLWHSGEVAHTEAMLNVVEFGIFTGLKMGIGVHAERYLTNPQLWELSTIPFEKGGALGLVEPLLYSGGMGIMGERFCPPGDLRSHCEQALTRIEKVTGKAHLPKGYYAFYDSDMESFTETHPELYAAIGETGLEYIVSTALPGRNRVIYSDQNTRAINHTPRTIFTGSPFIRASVMEMMKHCVPLASPGWMLTAIDSPVHAFAPYIWQTGQKMVEIADYLMNTPNFINVIPHTIARYTAILLEEGYLPAVKAS